MFKRKSPSQLQEQLASLKGGFESSDQNEWKLKTDASGSGTAVIRFLPAKNDDSPDFVKITNHGFKHQGKWYINNCPSTFGDFDSCPVCQYLSANDSYNTNEEEYKLLKRKHSYWANILVIKDPAAPENEGKVFKYRFGQKIMDKIIAEAEVDVDLGEEPVNVFCPFEGKNFTLKVKKVGGFTNYDDCKFGSKSAIKNIEDEAYQKELSEQAVDLSKIIAKDQFKSFDELETKFKQVYGVASMGGSAAKAASIADSIEDQLNAYTNDSDDLGLDDYTPSTTDDDELEALLNG
ncbi:putative single-stranded DNA binding protein [Providencia phage PSTCR6]|nr:putative single-stranded DNA binding protein [Providencia phage PSTCR6]